MNCIRKLVLTLLKNLGLAFCLQTGFAQNFICSDSLQTSFYSSKAFISSSGFENISSVVTSDKGKIFFFNNYNSSSDSLIIYKISSDGHVLWSKVINANTPTFSWNALNIYEMSNGNFIVSAGIAYIGNNTGPGLSSLFMLDKNGILLWQKIYNDIGLQTGNAAGNVIGQITEGQAGEFLVTGVDNIKGLLINRFDANGNLIANYGYNTSTFSLAAVPNGIFYLSGKIFIGGGFEDNEVSSISNGVWMMSIDYTTGTVEKMNFYHLNHGVPYCDSLSNSGFNGNGTLIVTQNNSFVYSRLLRYTNTCGTGNFIVVRLDSNLNIINEDLNEYTYPLSKPEDDWYMNYNEEGNFAFFYGPSSNLSNKLYAVIGPDNKINLQRQVNLYNNGSVHTLMNLNGYSLQSIASINISQVDSLQFFETSSDYIPGIDCSGENFNFLQSMNLLATKDNFFWLYSGNKNISETSYSPIESDFVLDTIVTCQQKSVCTALKINGISDFCLNNGAQQYTATKNNECLKEVTWSSDSNFTGSITNLNDSTIAFTPKIAGAGYIYASTAGCNLKDSLLLTISGPTNKLFIGMDTVLCPNAMDTLKASSHYANYLWQDGSTDSSMIVNSSGIYSLIATDFCGNKLYDTVKIGYSKDSLSAGQNFQICEFQDTLLAASPGYNNYHWKPDSAINGNANQISVMIRPPESVSYEVTATNALGCILSAKIEVSTVDCSGKLVMPSAFTPNGDGLNDVFRVKNIFSVEKFNMQIFNRWGQMIFSTEDIREGWNGTFKGTNVPEGGYVWFINLIDGENKKQFASGVVILIR